jgi:hypothetical protein
VGFGAVYIGIGILTFIILLVTFLFICCCKGRRNAAGQLSCCNGCRCRPRTCCYAPYWFTLFLIGLFIMVAIGLGEL